jgi:hypothetical protein
MSATGSPDDYPELHVVVKPVLPQRLPAVRDARSCSSGWHRRAAALRLTGEFVTLYSVHTDVCSQQANWRGVFPDEPERLRAIRRLKNSVALLRECVGHGIARDRVVFSNEDALLGGFNDAPRLFTETPYRA